MILLVLIFIYSFFFKTSQEIEKNFFNLNKMMLNVLYFFLYRTSLNEIKFSVFKIKKKLNYHHFVQLIFFEKKELDIILV